MAEPSAMSPTLTRREFIKAALIAPAALRQGGARLIGTLPLGNPGNAPATPLDRLLASSLDARLFTNLSTLSADALVVPNDRYYIRTAAPARLDELTPSIPVRGRVQQESA